MIIAFDTNRHDEALRWATKALKLTPSFLGYTHFTHLCYTLLIESFSFIYVSTCWFVVSNNSAPRARLHSIAARILFSRRSTNSNNDELVYHLREACSHSDEVTMLKPLYDQVITTATAAKQ